MTEDAASPVVAAPAAPVATTVVPSDVANHPAVIAAQAQLAAAVKTADADHAAMLQANITSAQIAFAAEVEAAVAKVVAARAFVVKDSSKIGRFLKTKILGMRTWEFLVIGVASVGILSFLALAPAPF